MKKKPPAPQTTPAKAPPPPAKQAVPPQPAPTPAPKPASAEQGTDLSQTPEQARQLTPSASEAAPLPLFPHQLQPPLLASPALPPDFFRLPMTDPTSLIDWSAMRQPFLTRGVMLEDRDSKTIVQNWTFTYQSMLGWGLSSELAAKVANLGTPLAYDFSLARDYPTTEEKLDREIEKTLLPGQKLGKIVVPIVTPDTLQWVTKKVTGKDIDFRF